MSPFMLPLCKTKDGNEYKEYKIKYKNICRYLSEYLTKKHESHLISMTEEQRQEYWNLNSLQIQTLVQDYFESGGPLHIQKAFNLICK